jgi:predicted 5'-methylthioadenosine/S-adenosylhomocysteine nucleosidase
MLVVAATEKELARIEGADTLCCGIGPVEAAARVAATLAKQPPDAVLHVGIAGSRTIEPLTVVLGSIAVYEDFSAAIPVVDHVEPDEALLARVRAWLPDAPVLPIGTSAAVSGTTRCEVEAMEGFGVLRACALAGVPAVELRVIANSPDEADRTKWLFEDALGVLAATLDRLDVL